MPSLAEGQARFVACLQNGPEHFPDQLFAQDRQRALLGLRAHANTISHARLVALEDSYPRLHAHIGLDRFHDLSRAYVEQDHVLACDINHIAAGFADFLAERQYGTTEIDLARIEWAWWESYRSADAPAVVLEDIATLGEQALLAFPIVAHPALRLVAIHGPLSAELGELAETAADMVMIARPEAHILLHPLTAAEPAIADKITDCRTMGNLLEHALEWGEEDAAMPLLIKLIQAGALARVEQ